MRTVPAPDAGAPAGYALGVARTRWRAGQYLDLFSHGGGGTETRFVCGFIESAEMMFAPMFRSLPEMLVDRADDEAVGSGIARTIDDLLARVDSLTPGAEVILGLRRSLGCDLRLPSPESATLPSSWRSR